MSRDADRWAPALSERDRRRAAWIKRHWVAWALIVWAMVGALLAGLALMARDISSLLVIPFLLPVFLWVMRWNSRATPEEMLMRLGRPWPNQGWPPPEDPPESEPDPDAQV